MHRHGRTFQGDFSADLLVETFASDPPSPTIFSGVTVGTSSVLPGLARDLQSWASIELAAQSEIVVPTALCTNASGNRRARRCTAFQPVQCAEHQQLGPEIVEGRDRRLDDRLEHRTAQVEPADDGGDVSLAGKPLRVAHDVDDPGVTTAGEHDEAATGEAHHDRLVVEDQRVRLPAPVIACAS